MPHDPITILGVDPGLQKTGWGVIQQDGASLKHIAHGLIKPKTTLPMPERLAHLASELEHIINMYQPRMSAIENTFVNRNPETSLKLGMARGALMSVLALKKLEVSEYSPNQIKKSVVGKGHAAKDQIGMMIQILLPGCGSLGPDEADALAIAITHAHYGSINAYTRIA